MEEWKIIEDFPYAEVSTFGRVKNSKRKTIRSTFISCWGYEMCPFKRDGKTIHSTVHRLVAKAFIPNPQNLPDINHKDGAKTNNTIENLEWVSKSENMQHAYKLNLIKVSHGKGHYNFKGAIEAHDAITGELVHTFYGQNEFVAMGYNGGRVYFCIKNPEKTHKGLKFKRVSEE